MQLLELVLAILPFGATIGAAFQTFREVSRERKTEAATTVAEAESAGAEPAQAAPSGWSVDLVIDDELNRHIQPSVVDDEAREQLRNLVYTFASNLSKEAARRARKSNRKTIEVGEVEAAHELITGKRSEKRAGIVALDGVAVASLVSLAVARATVPTFLADITWFWWGFAVLSIVSVAVMIINWPWRKN